MFPFLPVLSDIGQTLTNLYNNLVLPALPAFVVIMLAIGGIYWAAGTVSDDIRKVSKGKTVIIGTLVGAALVLLAGQIGQTFVNNVK